MTYYNLLSLFIRFAIMPAGETTKYNQHVEILKDWLMKQQHLPKNVGMLTLCVLNFILLLYKFFAYK